MTDLGEGRHWDQGDEVEYFMEAESVGSLYYLGRKRKELSLSDKREMVSKSGPGQGLQHNSHS